jgi:hypothetical protein
LGSGLCLSCYHKRYSVLRNCCSSGLHTEGVERVVINLKCAVKNEQNFGYSSLINVSMRNGRSVTHNRTAPRQCHTWQPTCKAHSQMKCCSREAQIHNTRVKTASESTDQTAEICYKARNYSNKCSITLGGHTESDCSGLRVTVRSGGVGTCDGCVYRCRMLALGRCVRTVNGTKF